VSYGACIGNLLPVLKNTNSQEPNYTMVRTGIHIRDVDEATFCLTHFLDDGQRAIRESG
jgi:hypothetical protein